ncbi:MAG TPA: hypothetical protein VLA61_06595 [Ideonella sp.]|uniref:hypothetical protein n=1 Tax=Ideonella sp. TaxID=1929293 RepID=UPI002C6042A0|nr:hypothetical protein [Ideonella sp.]HSI47918.1 hypothetical protein [Ideonella sp.]
MSRPTLALRSAAVSKLPTARPGTPALNHGQAGRIGPWPLALLAAVAVMGGLGVFAYAGKPTYAPAGTGRLAEGNATAPATQAATLAAATPSATTSAGTPEGVSAADWAKVQQALAQHPQREAELSRIGQLLTYQSRVRRFQEARQGGAPATELRTLARQLDGELDQHLANNEISAGEAQTLKAALLEQLQPDTAARALALVAWRRQQAAAAPSQPDPRDASYLQAQASTVAAWQAKPAAQRNEAQLSQQLRTLRGQVYAGNSGNNQNTGTTGGTQP